MTVPASLEAGKSGDVTLKGKWPSNKTFTVSADKTVTMTCDIGGSKILNVTFAGIELAGSNTVEVSDTKQVSVDPMTALFGNWSGAFKYNLNSTGGSSSSGSDDDEDWSDAVEFTVTKANRGAVGYTGAENENLVIPAYFIGDGKNGTTEGTKYKVTSIGISDIGSNAFQNCTNLTSVTISEGITNIGRSAFERCSNLTNITIPDSVTSIMQNAFTGCNKLTSITIPSGVTSILGNALNGCNSLTVINVDANNSAYKSINGVLFTKNGETLVRYPEGKTDTTYTIPEDVTCIWESAFDLDTNLTSISIPDNITQIRSYAFRYCTGLTSINIPENITYIGANVFENCTNLTSITFTGTQEQWNAIEKGIDFGDGTGMKWDEGFDNYTIHCTDGDIAKS